MNFESLSVHPVTYKLKGNDEAIKKLCPCFKVSAGSFSEYTKEGKTVDNKPQFDDDLCVKRKEKANIDVELRSCINRELIGKGHIDYNSLSNREGKFNEWIPLKDILGNEVGSALVEVEVKPEKKMMRFEDFDMHFKQLHDEMTHSMNRMLKDSMDLFKGFFPERFSQLPSGESSAPKKIEGDQRTERMCEEGAQGMPSK